MRPFLERLKNGEVLVCDGAMGTMLLEMGLKPGEFAALGDSANDIHMFNAAGMGLAVGNATPEIKAAADYVAQKPYGEGAAEALHWLARRL